MPTTRPSATTDSSDVVSGTPALHPTRAPRRAPTRGARRAQPARLGHLLSRTSSGRRRLPVLLAVLLLATVVAAPVGAAEPYPSSLASAGDSITRAYNTGAFLGDNVAGSWATGTTASVASIYSRVLAANSAISGKNYNDAVSGAKMADLAGQLRTVAGRGVDAVTVEMGGNDVCASSESAMTSVADYERQFRAALVEITTGSAATRIYVASIPNVSILWSLFKGNASARSVWSLFKICQSYLANPTSTRKADVDRRARVLAREVAYNDVLARVCAAVAQCRWDGGAVFGVSFTTGDVSTRDYFHPSLTGQARLAAGTWAAWGFGQ